MKKIDRAGVDALLALLRRKGYATIGPTVRSSAIVEEEISSTGDLPIGWTDRQSGGTYRLEKRSDEALFGYAVGPTSWKKFLFPPQLRLWQARRTKKGMEVSNNGAAQGADARKLAFIGVRSCELHAIAIQDKVFLRGAYLDPAYAAQRDNIFLVAVNCTQPGGTCFCASMDTGPRAREGYDLVLTEVLNSGSPYLLLDAGTERGNKILQQVPGNDPSAREIEAAEQALDAAAHNMGRTLETAGLKELLQNNLEHPRWDVVARRCLSCANCTLVCPTCFCMTVEDVTNLDGSVAERWRRWDSCFTVDFSYIHGGSVRASTKARYRQWMTHKLANWLDQFGTFGCVGCGRCITWCPVGIDLTEEARAIREQQPKPSPSTVPS